MFSILKNKKMRIFKYWQDQNQKMVINKNKLVNRQAILYHQKKKLSFPYQNQILQIQIIQFLCKKVAQVWN
jgi:hypothetical protein